MTKLSEDRLKDEFAGLAHKLVGSNAAIEVVRSGSTTPDGTAILRIDDRSFRCVLQISPPAYPETVREAGERVRDFASAVGLALASAALLPIAEGYHLGRSFAILPYRSSFSSSRPIWWWQRSRVAPSVLDWLAGIAGRAEVRNDSEADRTEYRRCLHALALQDGLDAAVRLQAEDTLHRLERGEFEPRTCPMHGDLWSGNVLRSPPGFAYAFSVIDWGSSQVRGFPIFDLIRFALSYRLSARQLSRELLRHAEVIGCSTSDTYGHLLAALGYFALNRGEMPLANFLGMVSRCDALHRQGMAS